MYCIFTDNGSTHKHSHNLCRTSILMLLETNYRVFCWNIWKYYLQASRLNKLEFITERKESKTKNEEKYMLILFLEILQTGMSPYVKESRWPLDYRSQPMDSGSQIVVLEPELWILDSKLTGSTELDPRFQTMDSGFHALDQV